MTAEWIGWFATVLFATSYAAKTSRVLKKIQALAACLWIVYGAVLGATPVVAANAIVALAALSSARRRDAKPGMSAKTGGTGAAIQTLPTPTLVGAFVPFAGNVNWQAALDSR